MNKTLNEDSIILTNSMSFVKEDIKTNIICNESSIYDPLLTISIDDSRTFPNDLTYISKNDDSTFKLDDSILKELESVK